MVLTKIEQLLEKYDNGFLGLNFHYLPYALRAKLLDAAGQDNLSVQAVKKSKLTKPCIKRYLNAIAVFKAAVLPWFARFVIIAATVGFTAKAATV